MLICALLGVISVTSLTNCLIIGKIFRNSQKIHGHHFVDKKSTNEICLFFLTKKHQFAWRFQVKYGYLPTKKVPIWTPSLQKSANLVIFSVKNHQLNTFLKTRTRTRLPGFLRIKTRNPLFQNPTPVLTSLGGILWEIY